MALFMRSYGKSALRPPVVVNPPFVAPPVKVKLAVRAPQYRPVRSRLSPPAVIGAGIVFAPVSTTLTYSLRGKAKPALRPPAVVGGGIVFAPPATTLAYSLRGKAKPRLAPPAVVGAGIVFAPLRVRFTYSRRGLGRGKLGPPTVLAVSFTPRPVQTKLAYSRRGAPRSRLTAPVVVFDPVSFGGPSVRLVAPINRRQLVGHRLAPPTILVTPFYARPVQTKLAYSRRGKQSSRLASPQVVFDPITFGGPSVRSASIRNSRQIVFWRLTAPAVVAAPVVAALAQPIRVLYVRLPASRRARARLAPPAVIGSGVAFHGPGVRLVAPINKRASVQHRLNAPVVVVTNAPFAPLTVKLTYSRRGVAKARLSKPVVVGATVAFHGPGVRLVAPINKRQIVLSRLGDPVVVGSGIVYYPVRVALAYSRRGHPASRLNAPAVVGAGIVFRGLTVRLRIAANSRAAVRHTLSPPVVIVTLAPFAPVSAHLTYSRRGKARFILSKPVVVGSGVAFHGPGVRLVAPANSRQIVGHVLRPAVVVTAAPFTVKAIVSLSRSSRPIVARHRFIVPIVVGGATAFHGPGVRLVTPVNKRNPVASRLFAPQVVTSVAVFYPVKLHLAYSRRGAPRYRLAAPVVVGGAVAFHGPGVRLVTPKNARQPVSHRLAAPVVVTPAPPVVSTLRVVLARSKRGVARSFISHPTVVGVVAFHGPGVRLVNPINSRQPVRHVLSAPVVVADGIAFFGPSVVLARTRRPNLTFNQTQPPTAVANIAFHGPGVRLVNPINKRQIVASNLAAPTVVNAAPNVTYAPVYVKLTYGRRGRPVYRLSKPTVIGGGIAFHGPGVRLVSPQNARPVYRHQLAPPAVVFAPFMAAPVKVALSYSKRGKPRSTLFAPAVVGAPIRILYAPITVLRAPSKRGRPLSTLYRPVLVGGGIAFHGPRVRLTSPSTGRRLLYPLLSPPAVVVPYVALVFRPVKVTLAYSRIGKGLPKLLKPTVVGAGIYFRPVKVTLVRIKPPQRFSRLAPPAVVQAIGVEFFGPKTHLSYSLRGVPKSRLSAPAVVGAGVVYRSLRVTLTYSKRGAPRSRLSAPVFPPLAQPIRVRLVRIRPVATHIRLPGQIAYAVFAPVRVHLAYSLRGKPKSYLTTPEIGSDFRARPIDTALAPSHRFRYVTTLLSPPTAVLRPHARPIQIHSVAILLRRYIPPTHPHLFPPTTRPPAGQQFYLIAGLPGSFWCTGKPSGDLTPVFVIDSWCVGKPVADIVPGLPGSDFCAGKPI